MGNYYNFVKEYMGTDECITNKKYCQVGHTFYLNTSEMEGLYWFYETENFIVDIHDFFVKENIVQTATYKMKDFVSLSSAYIISGIGESFNPYQTLNANSLFVIDIENVNNDFKVLLHGNTPYLGVAINFKKQMIEDCLSSMDLNKDYKYSDIFLNKEPIVTKSLEPLARDILTCRMGHPAAEIFFEAKAKEWMSIVIDAFINRKEIKISLDDTIALDNVKKYIDDHYAIDIPQKTLEKIAMMSGTKLKKLFKEKFQYTITEYTQRRRMNIAEVLLLDSSLNIKEIAESVGYSSQNKFTTNYKKYKGNYPREIKKLSRRKD